MRPAGVPVCLILRLEKLTDYAIYTTSMMLLRPSICCLFTAGVNLKYFASFPRYGTRSEKLEWA